MAINEEIRSKFGIKPEGREFNGLQLSLCVERAQKKIHHKSNNVGKLCSRRASFRTQVTAITNSTMKSAEAALVVRNPLSTALKHEDSAVRVAKKFPLNRSTRRQCVK